MIAVDTNILVAFHRTEYTHHAAAVDAVTRLAEGAGRWAIPWPCELASDKGRAKAYDKARYRHLVPTLNGTLA